jgi:hypothetical protein
MFASISGAANTLKSAVVGKLALKMIEARREPETYFAGALFGKLAPFV